MIFILVKDSSPSLPTFLFGNTILYHKFSPQGLFWLRETAYSTLKLIQEFVQLNPDKRLWVETLTCGTLEAYDTVIQHDLKSENIQFKTLNGTLITPLSDEEFFGSLNCE